MAAMQIPKLDPIRPARPFQLPSSRFDGSTGPRIIGPRDGKFVDLQSVGVRFMIWGAALSAARPGVPGVSRRVSAAQTQNQKPPANLLASSRPRAMLSSLCSFPGHVVPSTTRVLTCLTPINFSQKSM